MRTLIIVILLTIPAVAQEITAQPQEDYLSENTVLPTVNIVCFKDKIKAEYVANQHKGYQVYQNDDHGKINYCVLPPTHGETIAWITED